MTAFQAPLVDNQHCKMLTTTQLIEKRSWKMPGQRTWQGGVGVRRRAAALQPAGPRCGRPKGGQPLPRLFHPLAVEAVGLVGADAFQNVVALLTARCVARAGDDALPDGRQRWNGC